MDRSTKVAATENPSTDPGEHKGKRKGEHRGKTTTQRPRTPTTPPPILGNAKGNTQQGKQERRDREPRQPSTDPGERNGKRKNFSNVESADTANPFRHLLSKGKNPNCLAVLGSKRPYIL